MRAAFALLAALTLGQPTKAAPWPEFEVIVWPKQTPRGYETLARIGVTGAAVLSSRAAVDADDARARATPVVAAGLRPYVENIATEFYAPYHRFRPDHPSVTWLFDETKRAYRADADDPAVFERTPSLSDPAALADACTRLADTVRAYRYSHPLFYSLGDETGIADLSAAWDFDRAPASLAALRDWLRTQYSSLDALNRQWGTQFADWPDVTPPTTTGAMAAPGDNFSAWSDFKAFMDFAFARAVRAGTDAVHGADPAALAGLEGAQVPGWGGYDYGRLAHAVDVMEIYDTDENVEIARSLNPDLIILTTSFEAGARETNRIWHELLLGARGLVLWDEVAGLVTPDGAPGPRGAAMAPLFADLKRIAPLLRDSRPAVDPVAILYSPPSFRVQWMLDQRPHGAAWTERDSEREGDDNALRTAMRQAAALTRHAGVQPAWLTPDLIEHGALDHVQVLLLPHATALSDGELLAISAFEQRGGKILADVAPGAFDGHGRRRVRPPVIPVAGALSFTPGAFADWLGERGAPPRLRLARADGSAVDDVDVRIWQARGAILIALQRELPAGAATVSAEPLQLVLPRPAAVQDVSTGHAYGVTDRLDLILDPITPTIVRVQ